MKKITLSLLLTTVALTLTQNARCSDIDNYDNLSVVSGTEFGEYPRITTPCSPEELKTVQPFFYLQCLQYSQPENVLSAYYVEYNNYPFSLPQDDITQNTLFFSPSSAPDPSAKILPIIQSKIDQLIFEDFPESLELFKALNTQQSGVGIPTGGKGYSLHFFGMERKVGVEENDWGLERVTQLLDAWSEGSVASCKHLDFALRGMEDITKRQAVIGEIVSMLQKKSCENLETLSLRFMSLTNDDFKTLIDAVKAHSKKLKRLILSFNNIDDNIHDKFCKINGLLVELLSTGSGLDFLSVVDLRGNNFTNPEAWAFDSAAEERDDICQENRTKLRLLFSMNAISEATFDLSSFQLAPILMYSDLALDYTKNHFFKPETLLQLKQAFRAVEEIVSLPIVNAQLIKENARYSEIADLLILLKHGKYKDLKAVDLSHRKFSRHMVPLSLLRHVSRPEEVDRLLLNNMLSAHVGGQPGDIHGVLAQTIKDYSALQNLSVAHNRFGRASTYYGISIGIPTLQVFDFSGNNLVNAGYFGPQVGEEAVISGLSQYSSAIRRGLTGRGKEHPGAPVHYINFSQNGLTDDYLLQMLLPANQKNKIMMYDLSQNHFSFSDSKSERQINDLIRLLEGKADAHTEEPTTTPFLLLDLSGNNIAESRMQAIVRSYRVKIKEKQAQLWPVLKIDAQSVEHGRSQMHYVSSVSGLRELARLYDFVRTNPSDFDLIAEPVAKEGESEEDKKNRLETAQRISEANEENARKKEEWLAQQEAHGDWIRTLGEDKAEIARKLYKKANVEEFQAFSGAILEKIRTSSDELDCSSVHIAEGDTGDEKYLNGARELLSSYDIQPTSEEVNKRARLLKYVDLNQPSFASTDSTEERKKLFKSLTENEQKRRILDAFMSVNSVLSKSKREFKDEVLKSILDRLI